MASLGVNVGRTGGSMLADAMVTFRAVTMATGGAGRILGGGRRGSGASASGGASGGSSSSAGLAGFFKGGLIGMAGRHITNSAVKTATTQTSAVHTAQKQGAAAVHTASEKNVRFGGPHRQHGSFRRHCPHGRCFPYRQHSQKRQCNPAGRYHPHRERHSACRADSNRRRRSACRQRGSCGACAC